MGGHYVPEDIIRRRFRKGLQNFFSLYLPLADSWQMYDNSDVGNPISVASKMSNNIFINKQEYWDKLVELYDETQQK